MFISFKTQNEYPSFDSDHHFGTRISLVQLRSAPWNLIYWCNCNWICRSRLWYEKIIRIFGKLLCCPLKQVILLLIIHNLKFGWDTMKYDSSFNRFQLILSPIYLYIHILWMVLNVIRTLSDSNTSGYNLLHKKGKHYLIYVLKQFKKVKYWDVKPTTPRIKLSDISRHPQNIIK